ncbi:MAG: glycosyltransferase family protein, partial [Flavisolibacter sp.]
PVSAWACYLKNKTCIGFSHQAAVVNKHSPQSSKNDLLGRAVLKYYAPVTARYGFHYLPYDKNIFTPIIRKEIRDQTLQNHGHYTVYLPSYSDKKIIRMLSCFPGIEWEVFSKHSRESYTVENISVCPINNDQFIESLVSCEGVLCNAGFQTPAEAIFLKKKLMAIPMKGQYEQQCNAAALQMLGVPVIKNLKPKQFRHFKNWIESDTRIVLDFPDDTECIIDDIIDKYYPANSDSKIKEEKPITLSKFRKLVVKKIFYQLGS